MIAAGSLVGFALAFVVIAWATSVVAALVHRLARARLTAAGPAAAQRGASLALCAPPILASVGVVTVAAAPLGTSDHCEAHGHHLHLCLAHGAAWATRPFAVALVAALASLLALAAYAGVRDIVRTRRAARVLRRGGTTMVIAGVEVVVAPFERRLSFTAGVWRPRVYVSTAVWSRLDASERAALLAHEVAHARGRDVLWALVLRIAERLGVPLLASSIRREWRAATERLRDHQAAQVVGDPALVGAALVSVARVPRCTPLPAVMDAAGDGELAARIEALLAGGSSGEVRARHIGRGGIAGLTAAAGALIVWSEPVHHGLETVLAIF